MAKMTFKVRLDGMESSEVAALSAPFEVEKVFGTKARVPLRGTIHGFPFRSSLMPMGGCHRMVVHRQMRDGAGVKAGDWGTVAMERDRRTVDVPPLPKKELAQSNPAHPNWDKLIVHPQKGNGEVHYPSQAGRDSRTTSGQSDGCLEER